MMSMRNITLVTFCCFKLVYPFLKVMTLISDLQSPRDLSGDSRFGPRSKVPMGNRHDHFFTKETNKSFFNFQENSLIPFYRFSVPARYVAAKVGRSAMAISIVKHIKTDKLKPVSLKRGRCVDAIKRMNEMNA